MQKIAVVTGAYGGLGSELCKLIAQNNIGLVLVDRNLEKSKSFAAELNRDHSGCVLDVFAVDLADHADIRRCSGEMLAKFASIDFLFNNAGVLTETLQFSGHGNELHFEVNTLAPLQLIDQLRPALRAAGAAFVVNTTAGIASGVKTLNLDELVKPATAFKKLYGPYISSKQALNVLTAALAREMSDENIVVRAADPGPNRTRLTKGKGTPLWMRLFYGMLPTPDKGARKLFDAAFSDQWGMQSGIVLSGKNVQTLPKTLDQPAFQDEFLGRCRKQAGF